jgi:hypothetical protein
MKMAAQYYVELFEEPLDIDWPREGDELMHYVWIELSERVAIRGHSYQLHLPTKDEPLFYFGWHPESDDLTSELCLVPASTGIRVYVGITSPDQIPGQVRPWSEAIIAAIERLNRGGHPEHEWWAVIGQVGPHPKGAQVLTTGALIGAIEIGAATALYFDCAMPVLPMLSGYQLEWSFPLITHGASRGFNWPAASESAARQLNLICALLSVALDAYWTVRQAPEPQPLTPERLPLSRFGDLGDLDTNVSRHNVQLPEWCLNAWTRIAADDVLITSLLAHHQALALEQTFPSFALIGYVGAIEGLGSKLVELRPCACCDNCPCTVGAGRRFRKALQQVMSNSEANLLSDIYSRRSKTAHEGRLHAGELSFGSWDRGGLFAPEPPETGFRYRQLRRLRGASRRLLEHYLTL